MRQSSQEKVPLIRGFDDVSVDIIRVGDVEDEKASYNGRGEDCRPGLDVCNRTLGVTPVGGRVEGIAEISLLCFVKSRGIDAI